MAGFSLFSVFILLVINSGMWRGAMAGKLVVSLIAFFIERLSYLEIAVRVFTDFIF